MDWLLGCQNRIETKLAKEHLAESTLVLDDVSSSYDTGRQSSLIKFGYSRDGKQHRPQIAYGLIGNADGCPIAMEVFPGNTADPTTFTTQVEKIRQRLSGLPLEKTAQNPANQANRTSTADRARG